jgi:hypothetical protein
MSNLRIVCIVKHPNQKDRYHRIQAVGVGTDPDKADRQLSVEEVIGQIKSPYGDRYYVEAADGTSAWVEVRQCPHCTNKHLIIATVADNTTKDNLLELRECRAFK